MCCGDGLTCRVARGGLSKTHVRYAANNDRWSTFDTIRAEHRAVTFHLNNICVVEMLSYLGIVGVKVARKNLLTCGDRSDVAGGRHWAWVLIVRRQPYPKWRFHA